MRTPRVQAPKHLAFIRVLPCAVCGICPAGTAAHIRMARPGLGKRETGMAEKPDDKWAVPLCHDHHLAGPDAQHRSSEHEWWKKVGIDAHALAMQLWTCSGSIVEGNAIIFRTLMFSQEVTHA